ncbi:MAG: hypothetical protein JST80_09485 [Bdellovibrionales bacterium]|nr:hypothetical protein [Bdellovibrionales bacterium]
MGAFACGQDHNTGFEEHTVQGVPNGKWSNTGNNRPPFAGVWTSNCSNGSGQSTNVEIRIFDDRTLMLSTIYRDEKCIVPNDELIFVFNSIPHATGDGVWSTISIRPENMVDEMRVALSEGAASGMNYEKACGSSAWKKNRARSVRGSRCETKEIGSPALYIKLDADSNYAWIKFYKEGKEQRFVNRMTIH